MANVLCESDRRNVKMLSTIEKRERERERDGVGGDGEGGRLDRRKNLRRDIHTYFYILHMVDFLIPSPPPLDKSSSSG